MTEPEAPLVRLRATPLPDAIPEWKPNPAELGETHNGFTVVTPTRGWSGPYGQVWRGARWKCDTCDVHLYGDRPTVDTAIDRHTARGHAPCDYCGKMLLCRLDGTPRQHNARHCPGKDTTGHRIEREYAKNITTRELDRPTGKPLARHDVPPMTH